MLVIAKAFQSTLKMFLDVGMVLFRNKVVSEPGSWGPDRTKSMLTTILNPPLPSKKKFSRYGPGLVTILCMPHSTLGSI